VLTLGRARTLRRVDSSVGVERVFSSFNKSDDTLTLSPILVWGVEEEDCAFEELSTVMTLLVESADEARVKSARLSGRDEAPIRSIRIENIVVVKESCMSREIDVVVKEGRKEADTRKGLIRNQGRLNGSG